MTEDDKDGDCDNDEFSNRLRFSRSVDVEDPMEIEIFLGDCSLSR